MPFRIYLTWNLNKAFDYLIYYYWNVKTVKANSVDPDKTVLEDKFDLGLHFCTPRVSQEC